MNSTYSNFFHSNSYLFVFILISFFLSWRDFAFPHAPDELVPENTFFNAWYYMSKRVTTLYVIQWVLICWGMVFMGFQQHDTKMLLMVLPVTISLTFGVQYVLDLSLERIQKNTSSTSSKVQIP